MNVELSLVSGVEVEVARAGKGRPIVFLHGGDGMSPDAPFARLLAEENLLIAPSHPGFGGSELPAAYRTVDDLAYFYLDFLKEWALDHVVLVGVSFGGWIAAEIAIKCTSRIAGLILVDAVGAKFEGPETREIADLFSVPQYQQPDLIYASVAQHRPNFAQMSDDALIRLARNHQSFALYGWSPTLHDPKLVNRLHRIDVPTTLLWGAEDRIVSPSYGQRFAKAIPGAAFELIDGAGHLPHIEQPELFVAAVRRFIDALPGCAERTTP